MKRHDATRQGPDAIQDLAHSTAQPDWPGTIEKLMALARQAAGEFDFDRALEYLTSAEEIWDDRGLPEFSLELRFELHREAGRAYASQGRLADAIAAYQKILPLCRDARHLRVKSETFAEIGQLLGKQGDCDRALGYLQRAIGSYRRLDDSIGLCKALRNLGVIYVELGEFEEAELTYQEAISIARLTEDRLLYADLVNNLGAIMNMKGDWKQALTYYHDSLAIYTETNEIRKCAYTKNNVGITFAEKGMNDEAFRYFLEASEVAKRIKDGTLTTIVDINLAAAYLRKGSPSEAKQHCDKARAYLSEAGLRNGNLAEVTKLAGMIDVEGGRHESALANFATALEIAREIGAQFAEAEVLRERGVLYRLTGQHFDALNDLETSYHIFRKLKAEGRREQTEAIIDAIERLYLEVFDAMATEVDLKDKYTKGHSDRVASLSLLLARELSLRSSQLKTIVAGALLHDIGKIRVPDEVLKRAGRLTDDEYAEIKKHCEHGVELLRNKEFPWDVKPLILHHHERIDGSGYPTGLRGEDIPIGARIIGIADVFDALTSDRVYRSAFDAETALSMMSEESGTTFDPVLLKCFVSMIEDGKADLVINTRTRHDEMYSIWSRCMGRPEETIESAAAEKIA